MLTYAACLQVNPAGAGQSPASSPQESLSGSRAGLAWRYTTSLQAYEMPVTVLLKEYLPGTHGVAMNEVRMVSQLAPLPPYDRKWRAASDLSDNQPPVVPLLGAPLTDPRSDQQSALHACM